MHASSKQNIEQLTTVVEEEQVQNDGSKDLTWHDHKPRLQSESLIQTGSFRVSHNGLRKSAMGLFHNNDGCNSLDIGESSESGPTDLLLIRSKSEQLDLMNVDEH